MNATARRVTLFVGGLALCALLPVLGAILRQGGPERCALDGVIVDDLHRVEVTSGNDETALCCIQCARAWLQLAATPPDRIDVVDETTGRVIDAAHAWFVRSRIVTVQDTGDRIHAFASRDAAAAHADAYRGRMLLAGSHPFARYDADR